MIFGMIARNVGFPLCQTDHQRNNMQLLGNGLGGAEFPVGAGGLVAQEGVDLCCQPLDVDDGVAAEYFGQAVGEVAGQAFAGAFVEFQSKCQGVCRLALENEADVVGPFFGVAEQGVEEGVGPFGRKEGP